MTIQDLRTPLRPTAATPSGLEELILRQIGGSLRRGQTAERRTDEIRRLEGILLKARELEALGEMILGAVMLQTPSDNLDIPDFLRRY